MLEVKRTMPFIQKHLTKIQLKLQKFTFNIKHDSERFYAYVRSKQKVHNYVGPLEGSDGNIITEGFLMAENLMSTLVRCLPVPETKFAGRELDYL